ncbi:MAG: MmgE/PrpD family protein [Ruminococcaceae bacterium]|nr:MmgE/PrpD family protein [Oscillospiraceae bacterium]
MIHATEILSRFIADLTYDDIPTEAINITKMYIVDYYAACFAGIKVNGKFNKAVEDELFEMGGKEDSSVLHSDIKLPAMNAAFLNAVYAHGADMDDGNRKAMGHVAAHVMSAVFALAEVLGSTGKDIITAVNVGYEVYNRVAAAVQPGLVRRGFHSTGTGGAIACGAACAKLLGLDEAGIYNAISLSAIQSSGLMIITESGQSCKPINPANAARIGILSARLAEKGIVASEYPLESQKGWFHAMSDDVDEDAITDGLGEIFTICESYLKPYPSCRHTHAPIESAIAFRESMLEKHGNSYADMIDRVDVYIYRNAMRIAGQIELPKNSEDSKFSIHYSLATALLKGHFDLDDLPVENVTDDVKALVGKISLIEDPSMENAKAGIRGARTVFVMNDGEEYSYEIKIPKGDAANPFTWDDMKSKLFACSEGVLSDDNREKLIDSVGDFENIEKYSSVNALYN